MGFPFPKIPSSHPLSHPPAFRRHDILCMHGNLYVVAERRGLMFRLQQFHSSRIVWAHQKLLHGPHLPPNVLTANQRRWIELYVL
jgi:hypothetical protein